MIIDDDKEILAELKDFLVAKGYDTVTLDDTQYAVEISVDKKPDVILMDLKMPGKSGFELADEISRSPELSNVPIIGMSGVFKDEYNGFMNLCGIKTYLKKPLDPEGMIATIENAIGTKAGH